MAKELQDKYHADKVRIELSVRSARLMIEIKGDVSETTDKVKKLFQILKEAELGEEFKTPEQPAQ